MWSEGRYDYERLPTEQVPPQTDPSDGYHGVVNIVPQKPPLLDRPGEESCSRYHSHVGYQEYVEGCSFSHDRRSGPPHGGDESGYRWSRDDHSSSRQADYRDTRDDFGRESFYSFHCIRDRSPHKKDAPFFQESSEGQKDSPHSRSGSSVSSRSYSPDRSKTYSFHESQQRNEERLVQPLKPSRDTSPSSSSAGPSSKVLDKPSRLTEKEFAEAASKWAAEKLEKSDESSSPGISEFQMEKMENNEYGYPRDGSGRGVSIPIRTAPHRRRDWQTQQQQSVQNEEIPIHAAMARLNLGRKRRHPVSTVPLPSWGQIKKLSSEGQKILVRTGKTLNAENLFLAMCALLTVSSSEAVSYWAYIPNPPVFEPVTWGDSDVLIFSSPKILSPPWKDLREYNKDDGANFNFTSHTIKKPICLGKPPCLTLDWQHWLLPGVNITGSRTRLQKLTSWSINSTWENITFHNELLLPTCPEFTYINLKYKPFIWRECQGTFGKYFQDYVNWGPYGQFINTCSEWNITQCDLFNVTRMTESTDEVKGSRLMAWGDGGIANPKIAWQERPEAVQSHIWKIAAALKNVTLYNGSFSGTAKSDSSYNFTEFQVYNLSVCIPLPYMFIIGNFSLENQIHCVNCKLYTCLNSSVKFENGYSIMILQQRTHIWLPVNLGRTWSHDPVNTLVLDFFEKLLKRTRRFIGIVIATILSLIAVATLATVSGIALHTSLQTKEFVEDWHKDSYTLWNNQVQVDAKLQSQIDLLKQTVYWIGRKVLMLEKQAWMRCDWNSTTFCITEKMYNESEYNWTDIQRYLLGNDSVTQEIHNLQLEIQEIFGKKIEKNSLDDIALMLSKKLEGLDPRGFVQSLTHTSGGVIITLIIMIILILILYKSLLHPMRQSVSTLWKEMLLKKLKKKEGNCIGMEKV